MYELLDGLGEFAQTRQISIGQLEFHRTGVFLGLFRLGHAWNGHHAIAL